MKRLFAALPILLAVSLAMPRAMPEIRLGPRETVSRLDSLVRAGAGEEARALCTGQALRLLPLLIETQARLAPFLDTLQSSDTVLDEKRGGDWAALKMRSVAVFTRPVMGLRRLTSLQAVHLYRDVGVWKVADLEELSRENAPWGVRRGVPAGAGAARGGAVDASLLPVSPRAPVHTGATRLRLRLSLRGGDSLPADLLIASGTAGQTLLDRGPDWALVETRCAPLPDSVNKFPEPAAAYRASTPDLDLGDSRLRTKARTLRLGSHSDVETARRIYAFVAASFDYKLGASLFGTSREALRSLKGDCSEAAVLTAGLLRAAGIPSRVMMGFATLDRGVFIGHAWVEAWLGGAWIGIDPALRQFPAGAGRVALTALDGARPLQPIATNLMMRTLANLDIEMTGAWDASGPIPLKEQDGTDQDVRSFLDQVLKGMSE